MRILSIFTAAALALSFIPAHAGGRYEGDWSPKKGGQITGDWTPQKGGKITGDWKPQRGWDHYYRVTEGDWAPPQQRGPDPRYECLPGDTAVVGC